MGPDMDDLWIDAGGPPPGDNRLSAFVGVAKGMTAESAIRAAEVRLEAIAVPMKAALDDFIMAIGFYVAAPLSPPPRSVRNEIQRLAMEVEGLAGSFAMPLLGETAASLVDLIEVFAERDIWSREAVELHSDALRFLRSGRADAASGQRALEGARRVLAHFRDQAAAPQA
jgi:hypothetical protein